MITTYDERSLYNIADELMSEEITRTDIVNTLIILLNNVVTLNNEIQILKNKR